MNIKGKNITLRAIEKKDLDMLKDMMNCPEIEEMVGGWAFPISEKDQLNWYENSGKDKTHRFIIENKEDGPIGLATLGPIDWKNRVAHHGMKIANKKYRARGIGMDTVMAIMKYAFDELGLNRLDGSILEYNTASKKLYCDKCNWQIEGIKRDYIYKKGKYHNLIMVGILGSEYYDLIETNKYWIE